MTLPDLYITIEPSAYPFGSNVVEADLVQMLFSPDPADLL